MVVHRVELNGFQGSGIMPYDMQQLGASMQKAWDVAVIGSMELVDEHRSAYCKRSLCYCCILMLIVVIGLGIMFGGAALIPKFGFVLMFVGIGFIFISILFFACCMMFYNCKKVRVLMEKLDDKCEEANKTPGLYGVRFVPNSYVVGAGTVYKFSALMCTATSAPSVRQHGSRLPQCDKENLNR